ncbi:hypothetical protein [Methylobacterium sp. SyP6R]|uniref:hypothetical protein n=1 Tax=Methylobacterium sp. SyP6R TaxID=2718876 RepID=UPI001F45DEE2|nr:hypothetical protein [Methylobacterium sp. SyP6R]MCF4127676.1 hypothetical protein [Methylobacterium sp. SyP6R]
MSSVSTRWSIIDSATAVHRVECQSLAQDADDGPADAALNGLDDQVVGYGLEARRAYDELKRTIGQVAGLLILAQAGGRRDAFDLPALRRAEAVQEEALDRVRRLAAPARLAAHRQRMLQAAELAGRALRALGDVAIVAGEIDLTQASNDLTRAYAVLQSTSESVFGMTMVDFRHACCTCGAMKR